MRYGNVYPTEFLFSASALVCNGYLPAARKPLILPDWVCSPRCAIAFLPVLNLLPSAGILSISSENPVYFRIYPFRPMFTSRILIAQQKLMPLQQLQIMEMIFHR